MTLREQWTVENEATGARYTISASSGQDACQQAPVDWFQDDQGTVWEDTDDAIVHMRAWAVERPEEVRVYTTYATVNVTLHAGPRCCNSCGEPAHPDWGGYCEECGIGEGGK